MGKISLWSPIKGKDFDYIDQIVQEHFELGATGVYIHKYLGPKVNPETSTGNPGDPIDETTIGDVLFLENRERKYDKDIYELRGHYTPQSNEFNLTQFAAFLTNDVIFISFHLNDMVARLGRKIIAGDVIELPHLKDDLLLDEEKGPINRFFVVQDTNIEGWGPKWFGHIWRVKAKVLDDTMEFQDILGTGECCDDLKNDLSSYDKEIEITDKIVEEAARNVKYDPLFYPSDHFYVQYDENGIPGVAWKGPDGIPPNGIAVSGSGTSFPDSLVDGNFYLRTDFSPNVLFMKQGNKFIKIETDLKKLPWTGANRVLDTFVNNTNETTLDDGTTIDEKQALSKVVRPKVDSGDDD